MEKQEYDMYREVVFAISIEDIQCEAPWLTDNQALRVLEFLVHDSDYDYEYIGFGIPRDRVLQTAYRLFPEVDKIMRDDPTSVDAYYVVDGMVTRTSKDHDGQYKPYQRTARPNEEVEFWRVFLVETDCGLERFKVQDFPEEEAARAFAVLQGVRYGKT